MPPGGSLPAGSGHFGLSFLPSQVLQRTSPPWVCSSERTGRKTQWLAHWAQTSPAPCRVEGATQLLHPLWRSLSPLQPLCLLTHPVSISHHPQDGLPTPGLAVPLHLKIHHYRPPRESPMPQPGRYSFWPSDGLSRCHFPTATSSLQAQPGLLPVPRTPPLLVPLPPGLVLPEL